MYLFDSLAVSHVVTELAQDQTHEARKPTQAPRTSKKRKLQSLCPKKRRRLEVLREGHGSSNEGGKIILKKMSVFQKPLGHSDTVRIIICSNAPPTTTIDNNNTNEIV